MMNLKTPQSEIHNPKYQQFVLDFATYLITEGKSSYHPDKIARIAKLYSAYCQGLISTSEVMAEFARVEDYWGRYKEVETA